MLNDERKFYEAEGQDGSRIEGISQENVSKAMT